MVLVCFVSSLSATTALADVAPTMPATVSPDAGTPSAVAPMPAPMPTPTIGIKESGLRNGFSMSAGQEFGTSSIGNSISGQMYGFDWRIGARLAPEWSVYMQSHLSFGTVNVTGGSGATGNFAAALMGERDLPARTFVAVGGGYGVLNNPSGPLFAVRAGWYPMEHASGVARRLNLALDARFYFVEAGGESLTMKQISVSLGYDRF